MSPWRRIGWWIAILSLVIGFGPVAIAMIGGHFSDALGMVGWLGIVTLPVALIGAVLIPILVVSGLVIRIRRRLGIDE